MDENACVIEIYRPSKHSRKYFCRVIAGAVSDIYSSLYVTDDVVSDFHPTRLLYDLPIDSPAKKEARRAVGKKMHEDGLSLRILECTVERGSL